MQTRTSIVAPLAGAAALSTAAFVHHRAWQAERRNPPRGRFAEVDGVRLHYVDRGEGVPLVMLHGLGSMVEELALSPLYEAALRKYGIEYYVVGGHAFYAQQEVFDLVNLLRAVASRADDLSLAAALRSPFFSVADETLYWLAQHPDGLGAGLLACALPELYDAEERRKIRFALRERLEQFRQLGACDADPCVAHDEGDAPGTGGAHVERYRPRAGEAAGVGN